MFRNRVSSKRLVAAGTFTVACLALGAADARAVVIGSDWIGGNSLWTTPGDWSHVPAFGGYPDNVGGNNFNVTVNAGISTMTQSITVDSLAINNNAQVVIAPQAVGGDKLFRTGLLSINNTPGGASLDQNDNCMIVDNELEATIRGYLFTGYNAGAWDGPGIKSTVAANDLVSPGYYTGIAYAEAGDLGYNMYGGLPVNPTSIVMRYTYMGDANFDGVVNGVDQALLINGFNNSLSGWVNGDFDYNGLIDIDDFVIFDTSILSQGAPIIDACVPEPGSAALLLAGGSAMLARRRRRH